MSYIVLGKKLDKIEILARTQGLKKGYKQADVSGLIKCFITYGRKQTTQIHRGTTD